MMYCDFLNKTDEWKNINATMAIKIREGWDGVRHALFRGGGKAPERIPGGNELPHCLKLGRVYQAREVLRFLNVPALRPECLSLACWTASWDLEAWELQGA